MRPLKPARVHWAAEHTGFPICGSLQRQRVTRDVGAITCSRCIRRIAPFNTRAEQRLAEWEEYVAKKYTKPARTEIDVTTRWFPGDPEPEDDRYR